MEKTANMNKKYIKDDNNMWLLVNRFTICIWVIDEHDEWIYKQIKTVNRYIITSGNQKLGHGVKYMSDICK